MDYSFVCLHQDNNNASSNHDNSFCAKQIKGATDDNDDNSYFKIIGRQWVGGKHPNSNNNENNNQSR